MARPNSKTRPTQRFRTAFKLAFALTTSSLVATPGCGSFQVAQNSWNYNSSWNGFVMKHRNKGMAAKAWHRRKHGFCNRDHLNEFCSGFEAGYMSIADGGDGCTPAFAPREYWGWEYQTAEGQRKVASWFEGYPHGCRAAEEDGIGNWTQIQTSYGVQKEYHQAGLLAANQQPGMYPMPEPIPAGQAVLQKSATVPIGVGEELTLPAASPSDGPSLEPIPADQSTLPNTTPALPLNVAPPHSSYAPANSRLVR